jgi:hypothetical protein
MAVSFSVVLVLIDYYRGRLTLKKAWLEKIPFFILSILFGLSRSKHSIVNQHCTGIHRLGATNVFAAYAYITYIQKLIFPVPINAYYPYPVGPQDGIPPLYYVYPVLVLGF